jgi:putative toxin-antitoxin system antitoxin component (TIGR02293 family)
MAETKQRRTFSGRDFSLVFMTSETPGAEVRSAFRSKWDWVISAQHSAPARYATIISNLLRIYTEPEKATIEVIRSRIAGGLHRDAFTRLKTVIAISGDELSHVVGIPARTVARRNLFKPDESERILRVASAFQKSIEVLGSLDKARRWFTSPKRALGDKTPLEFCDTDIGAEEVCNLLGRIEHGVFT